MRNILKSTFHLTIVFLLIGGEPFHVFAATGKENSSKTSVEDGRSGAEKVPPGQDLVNIDFPEPTEIKDIIRAVALWVGKNVILGKGVRGKVQMISPKKVTKEEAYQAFLSALNVLGLTTVETGKIIKIMPVRNAVKGNLQIFQGSSWAPRTDKMITHIVPLKYINAKQIQRTLSRIVSTNSMIAYEPTNTLIISDTGYKVNRILSIIELLDVQGQQPQLAIVPIRYSDAKVISQKVGDILKSSRRSKTAPRSYQSYKISVDERSNSVIIFGPPRTISDVKALVKKFDFPVEDPENQAAIRVRFLDYADAKKLATTLSSLTQSSSRRSRSRTIGRRTSSRKSSGPAPVANLGDDIKITADESSNALLITGNRTAYTTINSLIRKLDQRRAQVYIEADILDLNVGNGFEAGTSIFAGSGSRDENGTKFSYGWQGNRMGGIIAAQATTGAGETVSDTTAAAAAGTLGKDFTIGVLSGEKVNIPGLGTFSPGALITLIKRDSNSRILASPHLLTSNNETAKISVGRKLFYLSSQQSGIAGVGAIPKPEKEDVDLTLEIKPNISHSGSYITVKIDLEANQGDLNQFGVPDISKRKTSQIVTLKNGQTAVISGLVRVSETESYQKIPLLGDIPILGWLFRNTTLSKQTSSLLFFITPHIVYGANDLAAIYEKRVKERDEIITKAFGADEDDEFMQKLPSLEDGKYRPDSYDQMEQANREKFLKELRRDMGYTEDEVSKLEQGDVSRQSELEQPIPVPSPVGEGEEIVPAAEEQAVPVEAEEDQASQEELVEDLEDIQNEGNETDSKLQQDDQNSGN